MFTAWGVMATFLGKLQMFFFFFFSFLCLGGGASSLHFIEAVVTFGWPVNALSNPQKNRHGQDIPQFLAMPIYFFTSFVRATLLEYCESIFKFEREKRNYPGWGQRASRSGGWTSWIGFIWEQPSDISLQHGSIIFCIHGYRSPFYLILQ